MADNAEIAPQQIGGGQAVEGICRGLRTDAHRQHDAAPPPRGSIANVTGRAVACRAARLNEKMAKIRAQPVGLPLTPVSGAGPVPGRAEATVCGRIAIAHSAAAAP